MSEDEILTVEEVSALLDDDVEYWIRNPFMDRDALLEKVRWWVTVARRAPADEVETR